jgi:hypothetical protein
MTSRWLIVVPIIFLAFLMGVFNLYDGIVSLSEANSLRHLGLFQADSYTITDVVDSIIFLSPQHAPLYFVILNFWHQVFGSDPGIFRLLSVFWGVLTVAMTYRLGITINTPRGGFYASLMVISSWAFMYYIHEIRQYAMVIFISATLFWLYWKIISSKNRIPIQYWLGLFLLSAISVYVHYFGILSLMAIGLYHVLFVRKDARWLVVVIVEILAGITFIPWLSIMQSGMNTMPDLSETSLSPFAVIYEFLFFHSNGLWFILLALLLIVLWNVRYLSPSQRYGFMVLAFMMLSIFIVHQVRPILFAGRLRYIIIFLPILAVNVGIAFIVMGRFQKVGIILLAILFGAGYIFNQSDILYDYAGLDKSPPFDDVLQQMEDFVGMYEPIVSLSATDDDTNVALQVREYYGKSVGRRILYYRDRNSVDGYINGISKAVDDEIGFWLLYWSTQTPLDQVNIYNELRLNGFHDCATFINHDALQLHFLMWDDVPCEFVTEGNPRAVYDNGAILSNVHAQANDDTLDVYVLWNEVPFEEYGVSLQIFDATGNRVAQDDFVVIEGFHHSKLPWTDMPSGDYEAQMILYNLDDTSSIGGQLYPDDAHFDRSFSVGEITVSSS